VVVNYRSSAEQAHEVVAAITAAGGEAVAIQADVTIADEVAAMIDQTNDKWDGVDVLVHNALIPFKVTSSPTSAGNSSAASWTANCVPRFWSPKRSCPG
jgi:NAD(P)-dependent dehydrogenase (short-subunit alcohol dehydrogenase family)